MLKKAFILTLKVIALTIAMMILFASGSALFGPKLDASSMTADETNLAGIGVAVVSLIDTLILTYLILRSRLWGWRLMLVAGVVFFGVKSLLSQIESWYFLQNMSTEMIIAVALMYLPAAILFPPLAVWMLGRVGRPADADDPNPRLIIFGAQLPVKLAVLALLIYPALYFTFGYFIAVKDPAVQAFYGFSDPGSFLAQLQRVAQTDPMLYPFQIMRALIWVAIAVPIIRFTRGHAWEAGLITALAFALIMNDVHIYPNPFMPREVSTTHFIETASSNFVWGLSVVWLLHRSHHSLLDLFGLARPASQTDPRIKHA